MAMDHERHCRQEIVRFGRLLHQKGYVAASDGNLTMRLDPNRVLATPTGISKGMMEPEDMVVVDLQACRVSGQRLVSTEIGMHLLIYRMRPDVNGVVHAHPVTATGYAAAGLELNQALVSELVMALGSVPLADYATPGSSELAASLEPLIPHHDAILMANHGVVSYGESLLQAYMKMETVEHYAQIALVTHLLGRQQPLSAEQVAKLMATRVRDLA
jgi:L-fuculose-phosphate aldolase